MLFDYFEMAGIVSKGSSYVYCAVFARIFPITSYTSVCRSLLTEPHRLLGRSYFTFFIFDNKRSLSIYPATSTGPCIRRLHLRIGIRLTTDILERNLVVNRTLGVCMYMLHRSRMISYDACSCVSN